MNNGYFAIVLDDTWTDTVSRNATMEVVRSDHITIAYKPDSKTFKKLEPLIGKRMNAFINELRAYENIEAFFVDLMCYDSYRLSTHEKYIERVDPGQAHITISHKKDIKAKEANTMFTNPIRTESRAGYVEGIFKWIPFNNKERKI